jgi:3-deoxy-D-manno-octulosonic-acid transferase
VYEAIADSGGCRFVADGNELTAAAGELLRHPDGIAALRGRAEAAIAERGGALRRTLDALEPYLPPKSNPPMASAFHAS